jgi:YidC/Oxa1 family membrane protein insertase
MEKRVLLAVVLSFIVLYGYQAMFPPQAPRRAAEPPPALEHAPGVTPGVAPGTTPDPVATPGEPAASPTLDPAPVEALVSDEAEREIVVENDYIRGVLSTRGAVLQSWRLKRYHDDEGQPLELVPADVPAGALRPFSLAVDDAGLSARLQRALFKPSTTEVLTGPDSSITFEYQDGDGLAARKVFRFSDTAPYTITFSAEVTHRGQALVPTVHWGPALGDGLAEESSFLYSPPAQPIFYRDGDVTRVGQGDIAEYAVQEGSFGFAGVDDHYFISAVLPAGVPLQLRYQALQVPAATPDGRAARFVDWSSRLAATPSEVKYFFGPKDFEVLASIDRDFVRAIHFGLFSPIVVPLLRSLNWIHGYVGNYGWSIIILTAIINILMFPLRHKSVVSMRKMQEIQPEVKAIQERYAKLKMTDPGKQKMNVEVMNLYRERGVNPASGCVPMLLTLPVLIGFYSMLSVAIELRGAPFIGWITDLSRHDPLFITPVLMGATQFIQTKMTPSTADPTQQKVMLMMPLMFMAFFLWAPSGLVLYWTVANMWAIGQQALTNKLIGPMPQRVVRPPAERKVKSAGGGRSEQASKERK